MSDSKLKIDPTVCLRCGTCAMMYPDYFQINDDGEVVVKDNVEIPDNLLEEIIQVCPASAISKTKHDEGENKNNPMDSKDEKDPNSSNDNVSKQL